MLPFDLKAIGEIRESIYGRAKGLQTHTSAVLEARSTVWAASPAKSRGGAQNSSVTTYTLTINAGGLTYDLAVRDNLPGKGNALIYHTDQTGATLP